MKLDPSDVFTAFPLTHLDYLWFPCLVWAQVSTDRRVRWRTDGKMCLSDVNSFGGTVIGGAGPGGTPKRFWLNFDEATKMLKLFKHFHKLVIFTLLQFVL